MRRLCFLNFLFATLIFAADMGARAQPNTLVVPSEGENVFLSSGIDPLFFPNHVQLVYASGEFSNAPGDILKITEMAFRVDEGAQHDINANFDVLLIQMEVFPGTMEQLIARGSGIDSPTVVYARKTSITAKSTNLNDFLVRFTFEKPFLYDRQRGQLVLAFHHNDYSGTGGFLDAQFYGDPARPDFARGAIITPSAGFPGEPQDPPWINSAVVATKFSFEVVSALIHSVKVNSSNDISISFRIDGNPASFGIESAHFVEGPFAAAENVRFSPQPSGSIEATLSVSRDTEFFRIVMR